MPSRQWYEFLDRHPRAGVEDEFGVRLEPADMKDLKTVGDAIDLVVARAA